MTDEAFKGDDAVPKSYIRKVLKDLIEVPGQEPEIVIRASEALAKLENYTGAGSGLSKREEMRVGVMIVQTSKHKIPPPKVSPGLGRRKVGDS